MRFELYEWLLVLIPFDSPLTSSKWCVMEITEARERDIPVICVVDTDKQPVRQVVDGYMEQVRQTTSLHLARAAVTLSFAQGFGWIFDEQVISYSTQSREHSYT